MVDIFFTDREKRPSNSSPTVLKDGKIVSSSRRPADQLQDAHFSDKHLSHPTLGMCHCMQITTS